MAEQTEADATAPETVEDITVTWRNSLYGLGTALCFALSAIFIRAGLEDLSSPLLGVTVGMTLTTTVYGIVLLIRRRGPTSQGPVSRDQMFFQILAGVFVGLGTWARWVALDTAPVAVVLSLGRVNVPVVLLLSPILAGRKQERVTPQVWVGAGLVIIGAVILNFYS